MSLTGPFRRHPWITTFAVLLLIAAAAAGYGAWRTCGFEGCPDPATLTAYQPEGTSVLLDRHGEQFAELKPLEREVVPLEDLPPHVPEAFVAVEDQRFYQHDGIDWVRLGGALRANLRAGGYEEGASTITMQLTRNLFSERIPPGEESLERKLLEMRVARAIEDRFSKQEILELYLNHIYFGHGAQGIEAASQYYFAHAAAELTLPEAALLAALPKAPAHYDPREEPEAARERRNVVLELMAQQGLVPSAEAAEAAEAPMGVTPEPRSLRSEGTKAAPYFAAAVRRELDDRFRESLGTEPVRVWTTLDLETQRFAEEALVQRLEELEGGELGPIPGAGGDAGPLQAALVLMDVTEGDVHAWVGGRSFEESQFDRVSNAQRQPGSAFKPFVLAAALAAGEPLSRVLEDRPLTVEMDDGRTWSPANFENRYAGEVTVREALVHSKNVAMVRLLQEIGTGRVVQAARRLGIEPPIPAAPSIALGSVEVSPLELATAYTPFATLGERVEPRLVLRVEREDGTVLWRSEPRRERVLNPSVAWLVNDVLSDVVDRGTGTRARRAGVTGAVAGKTGTSNDNTDAWFVGYTPEWIGAVWVGFDAPRSIGDRATGGRVAAPLWGRVMAQVQEDPPQEWPRPSGIVERQVDRETGHPVAEGCRPTPGGTREELFLTGAVPEPRCSGGLDPRLDRITGLEDDRVLEGFRDRELEERVEERQERLLLEQQGRQEQEGLQPGRREAPAREETDETFQERVARERPAREWETRDRAVQERAAQERTREEPEIRDDRNRQEVLREETARREGEAREPQQPEESDRQEPRPEREPEPEPDRSPQEAPAETPAPSPEPEPPSPDGAGPDLEGRWDLWTRITQSNESRYEGMTLGFRVRLRQDGDRITGSGEKRSEGGETLPPGRRAPIRVEGSVDGREVRLSFREEGAQRISSGTLTLRLSADGSTLTGSFRSDAASSRGSARMERIR